MKAIISARNHRAPEEYMLIKNSNWRVVSTLMRRIAPPESLRTGMWYSHVAGDRLLKQHISDEL